MYILVSYDISTNSAAGKRRLRMAAKICLNYGQRVQKDELTRASLSVDFLVRELER